MPALADPARGHRMAPLLLPPLDHEPLEQGLELLGAVHADAGPAGPLVVGAEQLQGEPAARPERGPDPGPGRGEALRRDEEQGEARDEEVGRRQDRVLDRHRPEEEPPGGPLRQPRGEPGQGLDPPVDRHHPPAAREERQGVAAGAAAEVEGEPRRPALGREAVERHEQRGARRPAAGEPVVGRPAGPPAARRPRPWSPSRHPAPPAGRPAAGPGSPPAPV